MLGITRLFRRRATPAPRTGHLAAVHATYRPGETVLPTHVILGRLQAADHHTYGRWFTEDLAGALAAYGLPQARPWPAASARGSTYGYRRDDVQALVGK
jgi:hypothetical protein